MMQLTVHKKIGLTVYPFTVVGENLHECFMQAQKLSFYDVHECGLCQDKALYVRAYITDKDKYEYLKIVCSKCKATLTFGKSKQDKDTFFLRRNDDGTLQWKPYEASE